jgi:Domain of unknown function (DUF4340)
MQRWIPILAVVLALQVATAVALGVRHDRLAPTTPNTPLVSADLKTVDHLVVDGPMPAKETKGDTKVELVKRDGRWLLPGYFNAPADAKKVGDLLDRLGSAKRGLPIAIAASDLTRFKVADDKYERRIVARAGDKTLTTVYLGTSPGLRKADARTAADKAVYAVDLATYDVPTKAARWLAADPLDEKVADLDEIDITPAAKPTLVLDRDAKGKAPKAQDDWQVPGLASGKRVDEDQAAALANAIDNLQVDEILGTEVKPEWKQNPPALTLALTNKNGKRATWTLTKPAKGDFYVLKASDRPWYLELKAWNARPLLNAADEGKLVVAAKVSAPIAHAGDATARHIN